MYQHLLVPVDDTDASIGAIGHATELAQAVGARITFLRVSAESGESAASAESAEEITQEALARAEAGARAQGVPCTSIVVTGDEPSDRLIAQARRHGCDLVCTDAGQPVAQASADSVPEGVRPAVLWCATDERPAVAASLGALLAAHRTLAKTLHEWLATQRAARACGTAVPAATMRMFAGRLREHPARGMRAAQKSALFGRLRRRTSAVNAELAELERLYERDGELLQALTELIWPDMPDVPGSDMLDEALSAYARLVWEWMGREQGVILPAARRYLSYADWTEIASASNSGWPSDHPTTHHDTRREADRPRA